MKKLSQMWPILGFLAFLQNLLPTQLLAWLHFFNDFLQDFFSPHSYIEIPEFNGHGGVDFNDLYRQVSLYLNSINPASTCRRLSLSRSRSKSSNTISHSVAPNNTVHVTFRRHRLSWTHHVDAVQDSLEEKRTFTLKLPKQPHRVDLLSPYLEHVAARVAELERVLLDRRLFTNYDRGAFNSGWYSVPFRHPSTFATMALEPELKRQLVEDLTAFVDGRQFYKKIGRAWKRGYFLYGPPGAGKSSLIAAMANFLRYDVYDLELSNVKDNSELRALLIQTTSRSIIVIEDIDCSVDLTGNRATKRRGSAKKSTRACGNGDENGRVTLSGLLNFTDGLWSSCGEERVIVFTTNHSENVDPALLRSGRMDVHVSLGTCGMHAFKALARNYLGLESHSHVLFGAVESGMRSGGALMTPAQIGEILLRNRRDADVAIEAVVAAMQAKILGGDVDDVEGRAECNDVAKIPDSVVEQTLCDKLVMRSPEKFDGKTKERDSCN